jgi:hypothetical protein
VVSRGPQALQDLLAGDVQAAERQLRLLTGSELRRLSVTADNLSDLAMRIVRTTWPKAGD